MYAEAYEILTDMSVTPLHRSDVLEGVAVLYDIHAHIRRSGISVERTKRYTAEEDGYNSSECICLKSLCRTIPNSQPYHRLEPTSSLLFVLTMEPLVL